MHRTFDTIDSRIIPALSEALGNSYRADFCVGYFNLRGWTLLHANIDRWSAQEGSCRLLVGMPTSSDEDLRRAYAVTDDPDGMDNLTAHLRKRKLAEDFRDKLTVGIPNEADERGLRRLAAQIKAGKVIVKLFLAYPLHAKLSLLFQSNPDDPIVSYVGSSNLTFAGLSRQAEMNVELTDSETCRYLAGWFEDRWNNHWCVDISDELVH